MSPSEPKPAIGVFICHCGKNIATTIDVEELTQNMVGIEGVAFAENNKYMCSEPGQKLIHDAIRDKGLTGVVIAACSPRLHEITFRKTVATADLNPFLCEVANIREQCSWVHKDKEKATKKAIKIVKSSVEKVKLSDPLTPISVPVTKKCMVIGAGISGIQAALDIADAGFKVVLIEKNSSIGGHMAQLSETFPTLDCSQCILTPKMMEVGNHPNIKLLTNSEVVEVDGYVGNFNIKVKKKQRYVDIDKCTGCNECTNVCPAVVPSEFNEGLGLRKAIYVPFPQAVPQAYILDDQACLGLLPLACSKCMDVCEPGAIDLDQHPEYLDIEVGTIIVATGYDLIPKENIGEYGYGKYKDVVNGLQFERLLSASGPTAGEIRRPSDGKIPQEIVFVQCVGSRDPEHGMPYCSKICCMYTAKHAKLYKHAVHDGQPYVFYIDIRSDGKGYEEFVQQAIVEEDIIYLRGKVSRIFQEDGKGKEDGGKLIVWGVDTLTGKKIEIAADMVVLTMPIIPSEGIKDLAKKLKISTDAFGFITEAHPKLRPIDTATRGIFLAGCSQAPKDIPDTVAQASGAAAKAVIPLLQGKIELDPQTSTVNEDGCSGCGMCEPLCEYGAIDIIEDPSHPKKKIAKVNDALCEGCGSCAVACPSGALEQKGFKSDQLYAMIDEYLTEEDKTCLKTKK
ncbi:MAG: CoB--CoM heterodisulfide reductase iron-sulfur subunit A family protein [Thermoplasmatales archaeon]|nr:MAG: CoB--CoM heterodisulfide reductase iron-sulfur subunit A family protein [Thermoplasmatales archaeon]